MSIIRDALEFLTKQANAAAGPIITHPKEEPPHIYLLDGERKVAVPETRKHKASSLDAVMSFHQSESKNNASSPATWYSRKGVVCLLDDDIRRDRVEMPLNPSPQLKVILSWGDQSQPFKQPNLILMLRTMFKRNMTRCPNLLELLRSIRFESGQVVNSEIVKSRASISKSIENKVSGKDELPDEFYLNVPIFSEPYAFIEGLIGVALEMDAGTQSFTLHPFPGDVERQVTLAEDVIGKALREALGDDAAVYYGEP